MNDQEFNAIKGHSRDWYGKPFFKFCETDHGWSNGLFGDVLARMFQPASAIELGCGTGGTLAALRKHGVKIYGIDGSADCVPFIARHDPEVARHVLIHDLAKPWRPHMKFDLAVSIETLEHVPPEGADNAVKTICDCAPVCVVTACPPVGRNFLHLNEQPFGYWIEKFKANGKVLDEQRTGALRQIMKGFEASCGKVVPCWYFSSYIGVFVDREHS